MMATMVVYGVGCNARGGCYNHAVVLVTVATMMETMVVMWPHPSNVGISSGNDGNIGGNFAAFIRVGHLILV